MQRSFIKLLRLALYVKCLVFVVHSFIHSFIKEKLSVLLYSVHISNQIIYT